MQALPGNLVRRIVPRWRIVSRTPRVELENHRHQGPVDHSVVEELRRRVLEWQSERTTDAAQELIWATSVFGESDITRDALQRISGDAKVSDSVRGHAKLVFGRANFADASISLPLDNRDVLVAIIRELKKRIEIAPHDPLQYTQLARLYSRLGQVESARKALRIALALAPTSRYVIRASARFLVHVEDFDFALKIIRRGNPNDPWIQAAKISVSDLAGREISGLKQARGLLSADIDPRHLTELAGALATLEFGSGNVGRAKRLFRQGAQDPNENMIAQLQWAAQEKIVDFKPELLDVSLTFEARASFARKEKRWIDAVSHCSDWLQDEPFSSRPASIGSFIAAELLRDYEKSIEFCKAGLVANPDDFMFLNNLAYCYAAKGDFGQASEFLALASTHAKTESDKVVLLATTGMLQLRRGQESNGTSSYSKAIELAQHIKRYDLVQMAAVHLFSEYAFLGNFLSAEDVGRIEAIMQDKRILDEVRDIYNANLKPHLVGHRAAKQSLVPVDNLLPRLVAF